MSLRSLTPDVYGTKKNTDLPMYVNFFPLSRRAHVDTNLEPRFNKFTPKKHSSRLLFKRGLYTLVFLLLTYTIYSKVIVGESPRLPTFSKSDIENNLEQEIEIQRQQQQQQEENDSLNDDHQQFKVTKDGIQEVSDPMEITTENLKDIKDGHTYVVLTKQDGIVYKRIFNKVEEGGQLVLRSDNPSYPAYRVHAEDVMELWKAKLFISQASPKQDVSMEKLMTMMLDLQQEVLRLKGRD